MPAARRFRSRSDGSRRPLGQKPQLTLVANSEDSHLVARDHMPIEGKVTGLPVRDHQLAQFPLSPTADQRVRGEDIDR